MFQKLIQKELESFKTGLRMTKFENNSLDRQNISSGGLWEEKVGYSRAVKIGSQIEVSGTTAAGATAYDQTKAIINKIKQLLEAQDSSLSQIIRTRIYTTDISKWEEIGKAHHEFFGAIKPATTMVEVAKLIHPELVVEIEFSAAF